MDLKKVLFHFLIIASFSITTSSFAKDFKKGFVIGSFLGEAYGGPREFRPRMPLKLSSVPTEKEWDNYGKTLVLENYSFPPSDYGHWDHRGRKGSLTDETRHKIIYLNSPKTKKGLAETYIQYSQKNGRFTSWLDEYVRAARWVTGVRELPLALPLERLWGGMSTQAGQMVFLFEALSHLERPEEGYLQVWNLNWIDQAQAKDVTSSVVVLSTLLIAQTPFHKALEEVKKIDPFQFNNVPYVPRRVSQLMDEALRISQMAKGNPHQLFKLFEENLHPVTWWEDYVPFVISIALIDFVGLKHPHAALKLAIDFGHDTDSVAHVLGAWLGAIYSEEMFNVDDVEIVNQLMKEEYGHEIKDFF